MKNNTFITLVLLLSVISSCTKDNSCPAPTYQISGLWIGTYTVTQRPSAGSMYYSFVIKPDATLLIEGRGDDGKLYYGSGTWSLNGSTFTYTIKPFQVNIQQTGSLTYSNDGKLTGGTWTDVNNNPNLSGTFSTMNRVN